MTSPVPYEGLHTSGDQIVDAEGDPVVLEGMDIDGLEPTSPGVTQETIDQAKAWGANFIRVPLGEQFWLTSNCDYAPYYDSEVDEVVKWITSLDMVALLDLATNTVDGCEPGEQHDMADAAQSPAFWSEVAYRYGNPASPEYNPLVAFDLYNEPHNISEQVWLIGGQVTDYYAPYETYQAAGMQQLYDAVRSAGAQNLVFISGNNWGNEAPATLVDGTDIVYAVHAYTCPQQPPPWCDNSNPYDPDSILDGWLGLARSAPVAVTEFGWPSASSGAYNANVIAFARAHRWSWAAFVWGQVSSAGPWDLATFLPNGTAHATTSGEPVLEALQGSGASG